MKPTYTIRQAIADAVAHFRSKRNGQPSHCDVRCLINDLLEPSERAGYRVHHGYSQDAAYKAVRRSLIDG